MTNMNRMFINDSAFSMDISVESVCSYDSVQTTKYSVELSEKYTNDNTCCLSIEGVSNHIISLLLKQNYDISMDDIRNAFPEKFI
jgi:hypothetical protein